jgi:hypothetical protein
MGRDKRSDGETDPGDFALVELYNQTEVGSLDHPRVIRELWDVSVHADQFGKPLMRKVDRGTVFSRTGRPHPDWDHSKVPVLVARFSDFGISNFRVYHGYCLNVIKSWTTPIKQRIMKSVKEQGKELTRKADDHSRDAADYLWHLANRTGEASLRTTTRAERVEAHKQVLAKQTGFEDYYNPFKSMHR